VKVRGLPQLVGVIHLPALPGAPGASRLSAADALARAGERAIKEAEELAKAGFDGLIIENFGDVPFYRDRVGPETVASMGILAAAIKDTVRVPVGINILRNAAFDALAVAAVSGADFIRVNILSGVAATDQGIIETRAAELLRERERLGAEVAILGDVLVKHARMLSVDDAALAVEEVALRSGASGVIITGATTGRAVDPVRLDRCSKAAREAGVPLWIGSGATAQTVGELRKKVHGVIVGSDLRKAGRAGEPLDAKRVRAFVQAWRKKKR
jgi:membrane complex biogenesis BtpA family protein